MLLKEGMNRVKEIRTTLLASRFHRFLSPGETYCWQPCRRITEIDAHLGYLSLLSKVNHDMPAQ